MIKQAFAWVITATVGLTAVTCLPASAERWSGHDPRGDGYVGGDIVQLTASNRSARLTVRVRFTNLIRRESGQHFLVVDTRRRDGQDYILDTSWTGQRYRHTLIRGIPASDAPATRVTCPELRVDWQLTKERIVMRVPQSCLRRPDDDVRVGFYSDSKKHTGYDWAPGRYTHYGHWVDVD